MAEKRVRIWLPDLIRGIAITMVVAFHLVFDLNYFYDQTQLKYYEGFWFYEGLIAAILFMSMVGVVTAIIFQQKDSRAAKRINLKRGLKLLGIGILITLISWLFYPDQTVWFGILHLMGSSVILSLPFARLKWANLILGSFVIVLGSWIKNIDVSHSFFIPFGIPSNHFSSFDYYPLIPWFGVILIGTGLGNILYKKFVQLNPPKPWQKVFILWGKNSLWIYLFHLPILYGVLWLILA